ncbi:MAG: YceI family protein [Balneolaceae bacterium]
MTKAALTMTEIAMTTMVETAVIKLIRITYTQSTAMFFFCYTKTPSFIISFFLVLLIFGATSPAFGQTFQTESGYVEFTSSVPLHSFSGSSDYLTGQITLSDSIVDFYVDLSTLDTGNNKRDKDMRETLEVEEHPFAEFYGKLTSSLDSDSDEPQEVTVRGDFSLHGITREVEVTGTIESVEEELHIKASWIVRLEDYEIEPPGILFYRVDDEQEVEIDATLTRQDD